MFILAFDPGGSTGWRAYEMVKGQWGAGCLGPNPHHLELQGLLDTYNPGLIVYERFLHTRASSVNLVACEYIGIIKLWALMHASRVVPQNAAEGKGFWNDDKLERVGLWTVNKHTRDATRHLLQYLTFQRKDNRWIAKLRD